MLYASLSCISIDEYVQKKLDGELNAVQNRIHVLAWKSP